MENIVNYFTGIYVMLIASGMSSALAIASVFLIFLTALGLFWLAVRKIRKDLWENVSWYEGLRIAWLMSWRGVLLGFLMGFIIGSVGKIIGISTGVATLLSMIATVFLGWPIVISQLVNKQFQGFNLRVIRDDRALDPGSSREDLGSLFGEKKN